MGQGAPSFGDMFWMGTLFLHGERIRPSTPDGVCADALHVAEVACAASCLADLIGGIRLCDKPAPDMGAANAETCLVDLLGKMTIANEPASDLESVGSIDAPLDMVIDANAAPADAFLEHVVIFDDPHGGDGHQP